MTDVCASSDTEPERVAARALHMMGSDAERRWDEHDAIAWEGLLEVARRFRRGAEVALSERSNMTISALGLTGRLMRASGRTLHQTELADAMGLSVSRVSRIIDVLEERGLVERHRCPSDARATNVTLTREGVGATTLAQHDLFEHVEAAFHDRLDADEIATLATVFSRLLSASLPLDV